MNEQHIVFVCVENSCRSQLAEALAKIHAKAHIQVHSAGSKPSGKVNEKAIHSMAARDYDLSVHDSKSLDELPKVDFAAVVTMGCGDECPMLRGAIKEDWGLPDPKHMPQKEFNQLRNVIEQKVLTLLSRIEEIEQ